MMLPAVLDPWAGHALYEPAKVVKRVVIPALVVLLALPMNHPRITNPPAFSLPL